MRERVSLTVTGTEIMYADPVPSRHERQRNVEMGNEFLIMSELRYTNEGLILCNYLSSL